MKYVKLLLVAAAALSVSACNFSTGKGDDKLREEFDSVESVAGEVSVEMDTYLAQINQIQANIDSIKHLEHLLASRHVSEDMSTAEVERLEHDINRLNAMLTTNRRELSLLRNKLSTSTTRQRQLEMMVANLTQSIDLESQRICTLEKQLAEKNARIAALTDTINMKETFISELKEDNKQKEEQIIESQNELATAYYVFGSRKELKEQGIVSNKGVLNGDFNSDYFVKIDARNTKVIPLYAASAKLLTSHPEGSYLLEQKDGAYCLTITNAQAFWSISKYLVIEVD